MASELHKIGRFDYVEPMNLDLDKSDTEIVDKPEDYCISVNLEVTIPNRFFEEEPTVLNASSDNGTVSFFGGVDTGNDNKNPVSGQTGFLSTSWTDISVNSTDKGNKDCIGIESINISYSPTFFPVVTIKFVDVRGASLFMPQQKAYEIYTNSKDMGEKNFESSSFFKSLFSMPSPIFKLTVKGFYGQSVTYKLMMSKSDFEFDSQNGNFVANVQFAGYMYGIYTELPMSYIALAPYIDDKAYWSEKNFTFDTGVQIPTIPDLIVKIVQANKEAEQKSSQSDTGKDLSSTNKIIEYLKALRDSFPFVVGKGYGSEEYKNTNKKKIVYYTTHKPPDDYKIESKDEENIQTVTIPLFFDDNSDKIEKYKDIIKELVNLDENIGTKYKEDFEELLDDVGYTNNTFFEKNNPKHISMPGYCYVDLKNGNYRVRGISVANYSGDKKVGGDVSGKDVLTKLVFKNRFYARKSNGSNVVASVKDIEDILDTKIESSLSVWKIYTNILDNVDKDLGLYVDREKELNKEIYRIKSEETEALLGFALSIENVYRIIFAHIDTFMHHYYNVLKETLFDTRRTNVICENKGSVCDVPYKILEKKKVPPYPTFVKEENERKTITYPTTILNEDIPETRFVENILNAATQSGKDFAEALKVLEESEKSKTVYTNTLKDFIPNNIVDIINSVSNPYGYVSEMHDKPGFNTFDEICYIFALRCFYFFLIYKKYRKDEVAYEFFAASEASNIKKTFGDKITQEFLTKFTAKGSEDTFLNNIIKKYGIYNNKNGEKDTLYYSYITSNDKIIVPIGDFNYEKVIGDKGSEKYLTDSENYVVLRKDGELITNELLNQNTVKIIENPYFFQQYKAFIKSDKEFSAATGGVFSEDFLIDLFDNYWGTDKYTLSPYISLSMNNADATKIFRTESTMSSYQECKNNGDKLNVSLKYANKNFTSFINGYPCIDTINVIAHGANNKYHFINEVANLDSFGFLKDSASDYDIAYYFLWSLPINHEYMHGRSKDNVIRIPETILLREGAQYYYQNHVNEMNENIKDDFGKNFKESNGECVPIVIGGSHTLFISKKVDDKYEGWKLYNDESSISENRKKYLEEYFVKWVNNVFSPLRERFSLVDDEKLNSNEYIASGLSDSLMSTVIDIYLKEVIFVDYSSIITRDSSNSLNSLKNPVLDLYKKVFKKFTESLKSLYPSDVLITTNTNLIPKSGINSNDDLKLSVYLTLQNLYNKFIGGNKISRWSLDNKDSDFNSFLYLDTYYKEIGQLLHLNGKNVIDQFKSVTSDITALQNDKDGSNRNSVYNFLSEVCSKNGLNLMAMPINPYIFTKQESSRYGKAVAWDLFDTIPYTQMAAKDTSCFISMYTYKPSQYLAIQDDSGLYAYEGDGFDINLNGEKDLPVQLQDFGNPDSPRIPSFAVTYAKQNQSIFKNINVSTTNHQITDTSIGMTFNIAAKGDEIPRESVIYGQDLYSVYSNYSYMCEVEMMGCAPISPMMYFQLNNIPMFKGAYLIYGVEHNLTAGNMVTKFKGNRVNKYALPFAKADFIYNDEYNTLIYDTERQLGNRFAIAPVDINNHLSAKDNPSQAEVANRISRMQFAIDSVFNCVNEVSGMCSRFVYNIAYGYKKGKTPCNNKQIKNAGGHAKQMAFHENLKALGYKLDVEKYPLTKEELKAWIKKDKVNIGDVYVYCSDTSEAGSAAEYGHTQIYTGINNISSAAIKNKGAYNWASSVKNNYGTNFVYNDRPGKWKLWIFRANIT